MNVSRIKVALACLAAIICVSGIAFWWNQVRPYIKVEQAWIVAPQQKIIAKTGGTISRLSCFQGKTVSKNEELLVLFHEEVQEEAAGLDRQIEKERASLAAVKKDLDDGMKKYIEANATGNGILEPALVAIQQAQIESEEIESRIKSLEENKRSLCTEMESKVASPVDGMILQQFKRKGEGVDKGDLLFSVISPSSFFVETNLSVGLLQDMRVGLPTIISFPSFSKQKWNGKVASIGPEVVNGLVRIEIEAADLPPYPGLSGELQIRIK